MLLALLLAITTGAFARASILVFKGFGSDQQHIGMP